jgi:ABC-type bacteriocin/lantibiotic exporter with double-glycine peptidase domain
MLQIQQIQAVFTKVSSLIVGQLTQRLIFFGLFAVMNYEIYLLFVVTIMLSMLVMCGLIKWNIRKLNREASRQNSDGGYQEQYY